MLDVREELSLANLDMMEVNRIMLMYTFIFYIWPNVFHPYVQVETFSH